VDKTAAVSQLRFLIRDSLALSSSVYRRRVDGELQYDGKRPGAHWHAHGYFSCQVWMLDGGRVVLVRLWKRRWLRVGTTRTCHSRPPDLLPGLRFCTLIVALKLWAWLDAEVGLHRYAEVFAALGERGSRRSVQRWLRRLSPRAMEIQQAIRLAVIERCEPRPLEWIFPTGLDPPERVRRKRWQDAKLVGRLWTALAMLFGTSSDLMISPTILLAEARRRFDRREKPTVE